MEPLITAIIIGGVMDMLLVILNVILILLVIVAKRRRKMALFRPIVVKPDPTEDAEKPDPTEDAEKPDFIEEAESELMHPDPAAAKSDVETSQEEQIQSPQRDSGTQGKEGPLLLQQQDPAPLQPVAAEYSVTQCKAYKLLEIKSDPVIVDVETDEYEYVVVT